MVENKTNFHTQISSLVTTTPDFLASLPSFRPQSPPFDQLGNRSQASSPSLEVKPISESLPVSCPNVYHAETVSTVSLPNFHSHLNVGEEFPCMMKRSSSVYDTSTAPHQFDSGIVPTTETGSAHPANELELSASPVENVMSSPSKSLPVFSGFAQMSADVISNHDDKAKQFFF